MAELSAEQLETILRHVAAAAPEPWYPKLYAETANVDRDSLDAPLEKLRLANLIQLTEWMPERGQGYVLTPEGMQALQSQRELARLRDGKLPSPHQAPAPKPRKAGRWSAWDRGEDIREIFLNPPRPVISRAILFVYFGVFLAGLYLAQQRNLPVHLYLYGGSKDPTLQGIYDGILSSLGSVNGIEIVHGQWWRLLTACFVHIGIVHLALNSWCLYGTGRYIEPMWGAGRYIILYVLSGIGGSCVALMTNIAGCAGGSGALFGVFASEIVWFFLNRSLLPSALVVAWQRNIVTNIILMVIISLVPGVSWGGHLGGAIVGAVIAVLLHYQRYGLGIIRWLALAALPLIPVASIGALIHTMNTSPKWVQLAADVRGRDAYEEFLALRDGFQREALPALNEAQQAYDKAFEDALNVNPIRREPEKKEQAIASLQKAHRNLQTAAALFATGLTARDPRNQEAEKVVAELLQAQLQLCGMAQDQIKRDVNLLSGDENETAHTKEKERIERLRRWCRGYGLFEKR